MDSTKKNSRHAILAQKSKPNPTNHYRNAKQPNPTSSEWRRIWAFGIEAFAAVKQVLVNLTAGMKTIITLQYPDDYHMSRSNLNLVKCEVLFSIT